MSKQLQKIFIFFIIIGLVGSSLIFAQTDRGREKKFEEITPEFSFISPRVGMKIEGGVKIETEVNEVRKKYYITIQDSGIGISAEDQQGLFKKFYRVKTKETADVSGTGLGLWIARELTRNMGGEILIESIEKVGSRFTVIFPLAP